MLQSNGLDLGFILKLLNLYNRFEKLLLKNTIGNQNSNWYIISTYTNMNYINTQEVKYNLNLIILKYYVTNDNYLFHPTESLGKWKFQFSYEASCRHSKMARQFYYYSSLLWMDKRLRPSGHEATSCSAGRLPAYTPQSWRMHKIALRNNSFYCSQNKNQNAAKSLIYGPLYRYKSTPALCSS